MIRIIEKSSIKEIASTIEKEINNLTKKDAPNFRTLRKKFTVLLNNTSPEFMLSLIRELLGRKTNKWFCYELLKFHTKAFDCIGEAELEEFGRGINNWGKVDAFACLLSGPAWLRNQISETLIYKWAKSDDFWWRRAAIVSTISLNRPSHGGKGEPQKTIDLCSLFVEDYNDMIVKALSWALRELTKQDKEAVRDFLIKYDNKLASRIKREVKNKLATGLKNPNNKSI